METNARLKGPVVGTRAFSPRLRSGKATIPGPPVATSSTAPPARAICVIVPACPRLRRAIHTRPRPTHDLGPAELCTRCQSARPMPGASGSAAQSRRSSTCCAYFGRCICTLDIRARELWELSCARRGQQANIIVQMSVHSGFLPDDVAVLCDLIKILAPVAELRTDISIRHAPIFYTGFHHLACTLAWYLVRKVLSASRSGGGNVNNKIMDYRAGPLRWVIYEVVTAGLDLDDLDDRQEAPD
ncbi:hypothetical protein OBBRIDRAFT_825117 [Obba rivulosa]|uniref:Uncharacterized protein n=1 Tax=Obba rivulosa TaxID=1052685 RepID=A0A8E2AWW1_9APHY|nr:hypothetical protein OBBRIDRAFT_825117 [Obba rivulosa]